MKNISLLAITLLVFYFVQSQTDVSGPIQSIPFLEKTISSVGSRLIGVRSDEHLGTWQPMDSISMNYSGAHDIDSFLPYLWEFDQQIRKFYDSGNWIDYMTFSSTFNQDDQMENLVTEYNQYGDSTKSIYQWDSQSRLIEVFDTMMTFMSMGRTLYSYHNNTDNRWDTIRLEQWDSLQWIGDNQQIFFYDANDDNVVYLHQINLSGSYDDIYRELYSYDVNHRLTETIMQDEYGSGWENSARFTFNYDADDNMIDELYQYWSNFQGAWQPSHHWLNTYDINNNRLTRLQLEYFLSSSSWDSVFIFYYNYDANNNLLSTTQQQWNNNGWENFEEILMTYNSFDQITSYMISHWANTSWNPDSRILYTYEEYKQDDSYVGNIAANAMIIYPNPATTQLNIELSNQNISSIIIHDLLGREIFSKEFNSAQCQINISNWNSGVYLVKIKTEEGEVVKKVTVQ